MSTYDKNQSTLEKIENSDNKISQAWDATQGIEVMG